VHGLLKLFYMVRCGYFMCIVGVMATRQIFRSSTQEEPLPVVMKKISMGSRQYIYPLKLNASASICLYIWPG